MMCYCEPFSHPHLGPPPSRGRKSKEKDYKMKIECYFSMGCASEEILRKNVPEALIAEEVEAEVSYHRIGDDEAKRLGLMGSPTILINGVDPFPSNIAGFS